MRDKREEDVVGVGAGDASRSSSEGRDVGMRFARLESASLTPSPSNGIGAIATCESLDASQGDAKNSGAPRSLVWRC
jgi:hypothetical protein